MHCGTGCDGQYHIRVWIGVESHMVWGVTWCGVSPSGVESCT